MRIVLEGAPTCQISSDGTQIFMGDWSKNSSSSQIDTSKRGVQAGFGMSKQPQGMGAMANTAMGGQPAPSSAAA